MSNEVHVGHLRTQEQGIVETLDAMPSYNNLLTVLPGGLDPQAFVTAVASSKRLRIEDSSDGEVSTVQGGQASADRSQRSDFFDFHTDGYYRPSPPPVLMLACENAGTEATTTVFADTKQATSKVTDYLPILERLDFVYVAKDLQTYRRPLIERHPIDGQLITNIVTRGYVEPRVTAETLATLPDFRVINEAMLALYAAIDDSITYEHTWTSGDVVIADNLTYVHARKAGGADPSRRLSRIWLDFAADSPVHDTKTLYRAATPRFSDIHTQAVETAAWQDRYLRLLDCLRQLGTEIRTDRVIEQDADIAPNVFYRNAVHHFVFPPLEGDLRLQDTSRFIDPTDGYSLFHESKQRTSDDQFSIEQIKIFYDDAGSKVELEVTNPFRSYQTHHDILSAVENALGVQASQSK